MENLKKNMVVQTVIEDMGNDGEGIGRADGMALFIKDAVIGDRVEAKIMKAKKHYAYARLERVLQPSPYRVEPPCPVARPCGGCQLQMLDYRQQLAYKQRKVENALRRIGGLEQVKVQPILGMEHPYRYRNKAQFPIGRDREGKLTAGFYAGRTHSIIPCGDCLLGDEGNQEILSRILRHMEEYEIPPYDERDGSGLVRHVLLRKGFATGQWMVCLVVNGREFPGAEALCERLQEIPGMTSITLNVNEGHTNVILGEELLTLWGQDFITDSIGDISYQISPLSFYQVNPAQTRKLYETALSYAGLTGGETVWDLYCGIGTISLFLAKKARKVYGVEIVPQAIENAKKNAAMNGISNAEFFVGKAEEVLPSYCAQGKHREGMDAGRNAGAGQAAADGGAGEARADVIVVDPPRKGCAQSLLDTIIEMAPERVVYVSCDPATLARDLKYLCAGGYEVREVQPVDMFGQTVHCECVVKLEREIGCYTVRDSRR